VSRVVFHLSGHGYGHAVRGAQIINHLPAGLAVEVASPTPRAFFERALRRPFEHRPTALDLGCLMAGPFEVDAEATAAGLAELLARRDQLIREEAERLNDSRAGLVVADSGFLPLAAAELAGLDSVLVASFTWVEIYGRLAARCRRFQDLLPRVAADYQKLTRHLKPPLSLDFDFGARTSPVGLIGPRGRSLRPALAREIGLKPGERLALVYLGVYGRGGAASPQGLAGWRLVGFEDDFAAANYRRLDNRRFSHADVIASADVVIGKLGYSLLASCLAAGRPLVYPLVADDWAERPALERAAAEWGGAVGVPSDDFLAFRLDKALARAAGLKPRPRPPQGNEEAARIVTQLCLKSTSS